MCYRIPDNTTTKGLAFTAVADATRHSLPTRRLVHTRCIPQAYANRRTVLHSTFSPRNISTYCTLRWHVERWRLLSWPSWFSKSSQSFDAAMELNHAPPLHSFQLHCALGGRGATVIVDCDYPQTARKDRFGRRCFHDVWNTNSCRLPSGPLGTPFF